MTKSALLASTAVALFLGLAPANAQMQQKDEKSAPSQMQQESGQQERVQQDKGAPQRSQRQDSQGKASKDRAQGTEPKDKANRGSAQNNSEPKQKSTKGTAERSEPKDKTSQGTAESEPKNKATKGTAEKGTEPNGKATKGTAGRDAPASDKAASTERTGSAQRVQITEEKRANVHQTILKERNVNRVASVNFSVNIGTRVPRSVRLAVLPASVITIVPEYRSYRYFVVDDQICIVEPATYEIVEVIRVSDRTAARDQRGGPATLVLSGEEKAFLLREIDLRGQSTLGIGVLVEGNEVPRDVTLRTFPATVVERIPRLRDHRFITAENRLAIVDERGSKVQLVIEASR